MVDAPTRVFHGLFALSFLGAYLTADGESWRMLHVTLGYTLAGLLAFRVLYGMWGPPQARLSLLWRKLTSGPQWLKSLASNAAAGPHTSINWRQGQNLLMALAVLLLVAVLAYWSREWQQSPNGLLSAGAWSGATSDRHHDDDD